MVFDKRHNFIISDLKRKQLRLCVKKKCMQCNEEKPELIFICHDENNECFVWEKN